MTIKKIERLLQELNDGRLIILYLFNGEIYLEFKRTIQKIDRTREAKSIIPSSKEGKIIQHHENSRVTRENSSISKLNESKLNESKLKPPCLEKVQDEDIRLTQLLIDKMTENDPNSSIIRNLTPQKQERWINQCRLLREKDERTPEQIEQIIIFSQDDSFWRGNILSMPKLRKQFDQLWLKAKKERFAGIKEWLNEP